MNVALYCWSGLGDALMALPLLRGLKARGHEIALVGNKSMAPFYRFLEQAEVCGKPLLYKSHAPTSWALTLRGQDLLLLPPLISWKSHPTLAVFKASSILAKPALRAALGIKDIGFIPEARIRTKSSKVPEATNLSLSYIGCLRERFNLPLNPEHLFLPEEILRQAQDDIRPRLLESGLALEPYAVLYRATKGVTRNMTPQLVQKILDYCKTRGWQVVEVGGQDPNVAPVAAGVLDWRGRLSFAEVTGIFNRSRLVFSIDGGLLHLALAARANVCSFWGPSIPEFTVFPDYPLHRPLCRYLPFQPYHGETSPQDTLSAFDFSLADIELAAELLGA